MPTQIEDAMRGRELLAFYHQLHGPALPPDGWGGRLAGLDAAGKLIDPGIPGPVPASTSWPIALRGSPELREALTVSAIAYAILQWQDRILTGAKNECRGWDPLTRDGLLATHAVTGTAEALKESLAAGDGWLWIVRMDAAMTMRHLLDVDEDGNRILAGVRAIVAPTLSVGAILLNAHDVRPYWACDEGGYFGVVGSEDRVCAIGQMVRHGAHPIGIVEA